MQELDIWLDATIKRWERDQVVDRVLMNKTEDFANAGYLSQMLRVSLDVVLASGVQKTKRLVVKIEGGSMFAKTWGRKHGFFRNEIHCYTDLLRKMENLMDERNDHFGRMWCQLYGFKEHDMLVFDDLISKGYEMVDKREMLDLEKARLFIAYLARFHALGMILLDVGAVRPNDFLPCHLGYKDSNVPFFINPMGDLSRIIRRTWGSEWLEVARKIEGLVDEADHKFQDTLKIRNSNLNVINHGDFRSPNLLVKRNCLGRAVKGKIVDFQMTNYNSLAMDLVYFLILSVHPDTRRNHYQEIIETYHSMLTKTLNFYNYPEHKIPSLTQVNDEIQRFNFLGFFILPAVGAEVLDKKDKLDMVVSQTEESGGGVVETPYENEIYESDEFKQLFGPDISHFIQSGTFLC